ncbi:hypothetical protein ACEUZ9_000893 [Paracoccus litorisediminis]|uniref:hypothetical protein n=1 Tax=Paracoccus litorisediminis TaxID=2006130 RepID=UPI003732416C
MLALFRLFWKRSAPKPEKTIAHPGLPNICFKCLIEDNQRAPDFSLAAMGMCGCCGEVGEVYDLKLLDLYRARGFDLDHLPDFLPRVRAAWRGDRPLMSEQRIEVIIDSIPHSMGDTAEKPAAQAA